MSLYTVTGPCVIGGLHYVNVPDRPVEVDDDVATKLVKAGALVPYRGAVPTDHEGTAIGDPNQDPLPAGDFAPADSPADVPSAEKHRRTRRSAED